MSATATDNRVWLTDELLWLADQGARFTLPQGRDKRPLYEDWQNKPFTEEEALSHAAAGGNVGLLTGKHSGGLFLLDLDREYSDMLAAIGPYARTVKVFRENEPSRGKLLYRANFEIKSRAWQPPWAEEKKPWAELLAEGRHGLIPPSEFAGGRYVLVDKELGIASMTDEELPLVWWKVTEGRPGLVAPDGWGQPEEKDAPANGRKDNESEAKAAVLRAWPILDVFKRFGLARDIEQERNGETRLHGNGGLLISKEGDKWYCFADETGGDAISAWAYCTRKRTDLTGRAFWDLLREMAAPKGIKLPPSPDVDPLTLIVWDTPQPQADANGTGPEPEAAATVEVLPEPEEEEPPQLHPLDVDPVEDLPLGKWLTAYVDLMTHLTGTPREFNQLAGLTVAAAAIQRKARLPMQFAEIFPNIYGAIIAPSSVYHKTAVLGKVRDILLRSGLEDLRLSELQTSEGLLGELQAKGGGLILRDEIGALFDSGRVKYLRNLKPDLTYLYDCQQMKKRLSAIEITVDKPYLNILGATTPARFYDSVTLMDWADGFLVRWLFALPEGEPDFEAQTGLMTSAHDASLGALAVELHNLGRHELTDFTFVGDAFHVWDGWQRQSKKDAYQFGDDITMALVARYNTYALKIALILAALGGEWGRISSDTMRAGIAIANDYKRHAYRLLNERDQHEISGGKLQKVFAVIKGEGGGEWVNTREIQRAARLSKTQLDPVLEKLVEVGAVVKEKVGRGYRYAAAARELPIKSWR